MSSCGWEVVGKNKKDKVIGKSSKLSKAEKKKITERQPKVEDFLPLNQVMTLYDTLDGDKENKKPKDKKQKTKENEERKNQHQQRAMQTEKRKLQIKEKPTQKLSRSTEKSAITVEKINDLLDTNKAKFPDAPLIWLKDLLAYVNATFSQEKSDSILDSTSESYPLSLIPKSIRTIFEKVIKSAGAQTVQIFYEGTLFLMVKNMSNESPDIGCKVFLQLLAQMYPEMTTVNIEKHISLRNSYQNKKYIGLSLLWALSQGGKRNLAVGLTLWHEVMVPMLESRTYAPHVINILKKTLSANKNTNNLTQHLFMQVFEDLYAGKINIPNTVEKEINECAELLKAAAMQSDQINRRLVFEDLMERITSKTNPSLRNELLRVMIACIAVEHECLASWMSLHSKHLYQSELLLKQLDDDWHEICTQVRSSALKSALETIHSMEIKVKKGKEEAYIAACRKRTKDLFCKMTASSKEQRSFSWKSGSLLLLFIGAVIAYDVRNHGSFEDSNTGRLVKMSGAARYIQNIFVAAKFYFNQGLVYFETTSPEYYKIIADTTKQYAKLADDFYLVGRNSITKMYNNTADYIEMKIPTILSGIEEYFPGWIQTFQISALKLLENTKEYSHLATIYVIEKSTISIQWLQATIFVGNWSPENIKGYARKAVDSTQEYAAQTYDWVYEKVQMLSKV